MLYKSGPFVFSDNFPQNILWQIYKIDWISTFIENSIANFVQFSSVITKFYETKTAQ